MAPRLDIPDGTATDERTGAAENGTSGGAETHRPAEEETVHLERRATAPDDALPGDGPADPAARPRWRQARTLPERSDVVADASHLKVDELSLELEGELGIKHLRLDTKGLEAQLFLKADLGNVVSLVEAAGRRTPPIVDSAMRHERRGKGESAVRRAAPPAGVALAGLAAGGALVGRVKPGRWIARRAVDRIRGRSALASFVRGLT